MHQGAPRQRTGHSILFKVIEQVLPSGHQSTSVLVEFYFNGIIGHLRDRWGYALDTTTLCSQLTNYWRSWFGAQTIGPVFETYTEPRVWENSGQSHPSAPADPTLIDPDHQIPVQILQVAWFLSALINQHPEVNAQLIHEIQQTRIGHRRDLTTDRVDHAALATLSAELSIMANVLAQQHAANQEIEASPQEDDSI